MRHARQAVLHAHGHCTPRDPALAATEPTPPDLHSTPYGLYADDDEPGPYESAAEVGLQGSHPALEEARRVAQQQHLALQRELRAAVGAIDSIGVRQMRNNWVPPATAKNLALASERRIQERSAAHTRIHVGRQHRARAERAERVRQMEKALSPRQYQHPPTAPASNSIVISADQVATRLPSAPWVCSAMHADVASRVVQRTPPTDHSPARALLDAGFGVGALNGAQSRVCDRVLM